MSKVSSATNVNQIQTANESITGLFPKGNKIIRYGVLGDGSCFFHSVCAIVNRNNYLHVSEANQKKIGRLLRKQIAELITPTVWETFKKQHRFDSFMREKQHMTYATLQNNFLNPRTWADQVMITLVSELLHVNIIFIDELNHQVYCGVHGKTNEPMLVVAWIDHSHFEPVGMVSSETEDAVQLQFLFLPEHDEKDREIVDHVMNRYGLQCAVSL
jgi:hypothetical protein